MGTNNGKVTSVISNSYQFGEGETGLEEGLEEGEEGGEFHLIMLKHSVFCRVPKLTHFCHPGNPITGRGEPINEIGIAIEVFQIAYVVITAIIIVKESKKGARISPKEKIG